MSTETVNPKSILTTAMENARAKMAAKDSAEMTPETEEVRAKRALKKFGIALVGTIAATTAVIVIANKRSEKDVDETPQD